MGLNSKKNNEQDTAIVRQATIKKCLRSKYKQARKLNIQLLIKKSDIHFMYGEYDHDTGFTPTLKPDYVRLMKSVNNRSARVQAFLGNHKKMSRLAIAKASHENIKPLDVVSFYKNLIRENLDEKISQGKKIEETLISRSEIYAVRISALSQKKPGPFAASWVRKQWAENMESFMSRFNSAQNRLGRVRAITKNPEKISWMASAKVSHEYPALAARYNYKQATLQIARLIQDSLKQRLPETKKKQRTGIQRATDGIER
ncbi:MAG: hypothetical protein LBG78_07170 [Azoarcus sp.]|jgi:hypothetical protein|nr:hypothetical protein [Azoarcus sp.]